MERDTIKDIMDDLRGTPYASLAEGLSRTLAEGKTEFVKEHRRSASVARRHNTEPVVFEAVEAESVDRKAREKLDVRVRPFSEREESEIVLRAVERKFVAPKALLFPIEKFLDRFGLKEVVFVDEHDERNNVTLDEFRTVFADPSVDMLRATISDTLRDLK